MPARNAVWMFVAAAWIFPGCAIVSTRAFNSGATQQQTETGLQYSINTYPGGLFTSESINFPPLLHVGYVRPPFNISLHVEDTLQTFARLEIHSVTVQYEGEEPRAIATENSVHFFQQRNLDSPEIRQDIAQIDDHKTVTVTVKAAVIRRDGTIVELDITETFSPTSFDRITDWFSWVASC